MREVRKLGLMVIMAVILIGTCFVKSSTINVEAQENGKEIILHNSNNDNNAIAVLTNLQNGDKYLCNTKMVNRIKKVDNKNNNTYITESEVQVIIPQEKSDNVALFADDFISNKEYDESKSWTAYIRTTYKKSGDKYLVTKVNGNWKCYDTSVKISSREVTYACGHDNIVYKKPTSNTFSYSTGFKKYTKVNYFDRAGANSHCYLKRGTGKKWKLEVLANIPT